MTLRGQQLLQQQQQQQQHQYHQQQDPDQTGFVGQSLEPTRGSETRSRNALTLNFQGYRKPFFPPKVITFWKQTHRSSFRVDRVELGP